jgi:hypothetical protein
MSKPFVLLNIDHDSRTAVIQYQSITLRIAPRVQNSCWLNIGLRCLDGTTFYGLSASMVHSDDFVDIVTLIKDRLVKQDSDMLAAIKSMVSKAYVNI